MKARHVVTIYSLLRGRSAGVKYTMNHARDLLERTPDDELEKMILELGCYALRVRNEYRWRTRDREALPKGETVKSVVSLAVEKVLTGERKWNPAQQPDFMKFMRDVIDSLIYHLARSKDNALLTTLQEEGGQDEMSWRAESDRAKPGAPTHLILTAFFLESREQGVVR